MQRAGEDTMSEGLRFSTAKDVFEAYPTAGEDITAGPSDMPVIDYARALAASATPENAITFCAYMLRTRVAVWWGHQCLNALPETLSQQDRELLDLAEAWVREPADETRNAALAAGMEAPTKTPAAWVALAAGWSGGSMLPPDATPVPPPSHLTPKAVNAAVLSVLARVPAAQRAQTLRRFVEMGLQLADSA
jgi:hypothetical protein